MRSGDARQAVACCRASSARRAGALPSLDHLIGELLKLYRYIEPQRSRGLEVDRQFNVRGVFHRQVAGIRPLQNPLHEVSRSDEKLGP